MINAAAEGEQPTQELREALALYETTQDICSRLDLDDLLFALVRRANELLGGDVAYLATAHDDDRQIRVRAWDRITSERFQQLVLSYDVGLGGAVAAQRRAIATIDYPRESSLTHATYVDEIVSEEGLRSAVGAPVQFGDRLLAVLFVARRTATHFTAHQVTLLSSLANSAAIALNNAQLYEQLASAMGVHRRLMTAALSDRGEQAVADALADLVRGAVQLVDWTGQELVRAEPWQPLGVTSGQLRAVLENDALDVGEPGVLVRRITVGSLVEGLLLVRPGLEQPELTEVAVEQAVTVFALELMKRRSAEQAEAQWQGDLLDRLLAEPIADEGSVVRQAARAGLDLSGPEYVIAVLRSRDQGEQGAPGRWHRVLALLRSTPGDLAADMAVVRPDAVVLAWQGVGDDEVQTRGRKIVADAGARTGLDLVLGVGGAARGAAAFARSYLEAQRASAVARDRPSGTGVVSFADLGFHHLVLGARPADELALHARAVLAPLMTHDERGRGGSLVQAVRDYLEAAGNVEAAARAAHTHPNTLRQRLSTAEQLLGSDLRDPATRLELHLALLVLTPDM